MNTTVKVYKGVPLVKGGTEVLYLAQGAAEGQLSAFLHKTYTEYYYTREHRNVIQVKDVIQNLEGCNYVSFANMSHGGKIFFGFIDQIVYINDNNTEIRFTVDPFPTYLGDTNVRQDAFIIRNTDKYDVRGQNLQPDYLPDSVKTQFEVSNGIRLHADTLIGYFVAQGGTAPEIMNSGVKLSRLTDAIIDSIHEHGGEIIGAYMMPSSWVPMAGAMNPTFSAGQVTLNPFTSLAGFTHNKIRSGVYNKLILNTPAGSKPFDIENFADPTNIVFDVIGILIPTPCAFIYPKSYMGIPNNLAEGVLVPFPAMPIVSNPVYTKAEEYHDNISMTTGVMGALMGGLLGRNPGGILAGTAEAIAGRFENEFGKVYDTPSYTQASNPCLDVNGDYWFILTCAHPSQNDLLKIDKYFDYYGYNVRCPLAGGFVVNTDDEAYLQTGSEFLYGSEVDDDLNERIMHGIKIRKTLS